MGSGIENHSKYAEAIYAESRDTGVYVNLFYSFATELESQGWQLRMETAFPESNLVRIRLQENRQRSSGCAFASRLVGVTTGWVEWPSRWRRPRRKTVISCSRGAGNPATSEYEPNMQLYTESMPDNPGSRSLLVRALVLAGQLGDTIP